jgi:hypothetical protein
MAEYGSDPGWIAYQQQMNEENMRTLVILHRVYSGIMAAFSLCFVGYMVFFLAIFSVADASKPSQQMPPEMKTVFATVWGIAFVFVLGLAALNLVCANWIRDRRNWVGVVVVSGINCLHMPLGLALGIYTLVVVNRPHVRSTFR